MLATAPLCNGPALYAKAPSDVESTGFLGIAYLAVRSLRGLPVTFPGTTGAPRPLTGRVLAKP